MRALQEVVEQRAEIGLENLKLALSHGHNCWKIVANLRVVRRSPVRTVLEVAQFARAIGRQAPMIVANNQSSRKASASSIAGFRRTSRGLATSLRVRRCLTDGQKPGAGYA